MEDIKYDAWNAPQWLADVAEALGKTCPVDGAPLVLNWKQVLDAIRELREDRDKWKRLSDDEQEN